MTPVLDMYKICMTKRFFTWDPAKAKANPHNHAGVTFAEAIEAFADPGAVELEDQEHSDDELRIKLIGLSTRRLLLVIFCEQDFLATGEIGTRIISARKANQIEEEIYADNQTGE